MNLIKHVNMMDKNISDDLMKLYLSPMAAIVAL